MQSKNFVQVTDARGLNYDISEAEDKHDLFTLDSDQFFPFPHVEAKEVNDVKVYYQEARPIEFNVGYQADTGTQLKFYIESDTDGDYEEIFTLDTQGDHDVSRPFDDNDFASLNSKYEIYNQSGYKVFPPEGNVYTFNDGSLNPANLDNGSYAVELVTGDTNNDIVGYRFTEVESSDQGATYATKSDGSVTNFESNDPNMLYNQKHYPVNEFTWDAAGDVYIVGENKINGVEEGIYARVENENDGSVSLEKAVLDETTTQVGIVRVTEDTSTEEANDYEISDGAVPTYLTADQYNSLNGINADGFLSADAENLWNDLIDHSQSWEPTNFVATVYEEEGDTESGTPVAEGQQIFRIVGNNDAGTNASDMNSNMPSDMNSNMPSDMNSNMPSDMNSNMPSDMYSNMPSDMYSNMPSDMYSNMPSDMYSNMPSDMYSNMPSDMNYTIRYVFKYTIRYVFKYAIRYVF